MIAKFAAGALALALCASPAGAATITVEQGAFAAGDLVFATETQQAFYPPFDPASGTLISTTVEATGTVSWQQGGGATLITPTGPDPTIVYQGDFGILDQNDDVFASQITIDSSPITDSYSVGGTFPVDVSGQVPIDVPYVDLYFYVDNFIAFDDFTAFGLGTANDMGGSFTGTLTWTFDYTPAVPAPPALPVLAMGLAGLAAVRRRHARNGRAEEGARSR
jgi:hypothetical protein